MHYANGTPAKTGDVVLTKRYNREVVAGIIHSLNANTTQCNAMIAIPIPGGVSQECATVGECYSAEEAYAAMAEKQSAKNAD